MIKLYKSPAYNQHWVAHVPGTGWLVFPAQKNGWNKRQPVRDLDLINLREVPLWLAFNTGVIHTALDEARRARRSHNNSDAPSSGRDL
jgi:hypothetical protein